MSIRSILSCYTGNGGGPAALHMAILMAQKYDARITGALWQAPNPLRRRAGAFFTREIDSILDQAEVEQAWDAFAVENYRKAKELADKAAALK